VEGGRERLENRGGRKDYYLFQRGGRFLRVLKEGGEKRTGTRKLSRISFLNVKAGGLMPAAKKFRDISRDLSKKEGKLMREPAT